MLVNAQRSSSTFGRDNDETVTLCLDHVVGQTTNEPLTEVSHALSVSHVAGAEAVVELTKVAVKVLGGNVDVRALETALQLREVVLAQVGSTGLVSGVDTGLVVNGVVTSHRPTNGNVATVRVSVQSGCSDVHVLADHISERCTVNPGNDCRTRLTAIGVNDGNYGSFVGSSTSATVALVGVHELRVTTDVRLVNNYVAVKENAVIVTHGLANTVKHVPRSAWAESVLELNLAGGNPVLGRTHLEDHHDPDTNGNLGRVHHRSGQHRELFAARVAPPHATLAPTPTSGSAAHAVLRSDVVNVDGITLGATRLAVPAEVFKTEVGVGFGDNVAAQTGNRCLHSSIITGGCDTICT